MIPVDAGLLAVLGAFACLGLFHLIVDIWNGIDLIIRDLRGRD